jgi:AraC family transcriptional regulator
MKRVLASSPVSRAGTDRMRQEASKRDRPLGPLATLLRILPFEPAAESDRLGWIGLEAARFRAAPAAELNPPALTHHRLVLFTRPPDVLDLRYEGVKRLVPPPAGAIALVPAGIPVRWRWSGCFDWLHIFLEPGLVARVAAEAFDLDPARLTIPPLDNLDLPHLRAAMGAVDAELTAGGLGGQLAAESLANVLAVHLIRHVLAPRRPERGRDGALPQGRLRAVVEYIEEHLDASPSLEQISAVARLSPYHFARQFKAATGLPPHEYLIARRVERAKQFLQGSGDLSLAEVAAQAGFSDQSKFSHHFKHLVGVTPQQFRMSARIG